MHNLVGFVLIANFFLWLLFYLFSDRIKAYHPELSPRKHFLGSFRQIYYYGYGIFKGDPNPFHVSIYRKFNPLQSMIYQVIMMLLLPIQFYTGILLWDVKRFSAQVDFFGGVRVIDTVHVLIFITLVFYVIVHAYLGTLGHTRTTHYKAMLTGYEDVEVVNPLRLAPNPRRPATPAPPDRIAPAPRRIGCGRRAEQPFTMRSGPRCRRRRVRCRARG